ncbi:ROK family protein [Clostridium estertheticum]|uniref:Glucokinase n=1 Tax=Clostridium estertheticum TaxID=238834 RepID=A0A5N7INS9_9CLOT|nr:ROK family glucokinase [Clostridium estertheticum]MBU3074409.1 ROK family glucokinase [Clostridium estertheticum]MBU3164503.1 ROK family glucokinase [Clostridium estertheticum]MBU3184511.1 ROK family glucokinase [Clostridium estertheticum]MCB2343002.1 ROK family glucokinase [Clostridium estertheticum]MPQ31970.1 ROK family glucokinase [Clostridium estertheticum]
MYIGIDLGGTNIAIGIVDENGKIIHEESCETRSEREPQELIDDMIGLVLKVLDEYHMQLNEITAIGVGIPGLADKDGNVIFCVNLGWRNVPLRKMLEDVLHTPVYIDNDATVAALAEYESGSMQNCKSGLMLTLGTGIGGGIIINGEIYSGFNGVGSELGHTVIGENFYNCNCGRNGCLETFASSTAIIKYTKKLIMEMNEPTTITENVEGNIDNLNAKIIFDCAKKGDKIAALAVNRLIKYLGIGIINIVNFIDPEIIVLGGGIAGAGQYLLDLITKEVLANKYYKDLPIAKIVLAQLGNKAGVIGAAMVAKHGDV